MSQESSNNIESNNKFSSLAVELSMEEKVNSIFIDMKILKSELSEAKKENKDLRNMMTEQEKTIKELRDELDEREQRERNFALRVNHVSISKEEEDKFGHNVAAARAVFNKAIKPVLDKPGVRQKLDQPVEHWSDLIETAHILPTNKGDVKPIIVKLKSRPIRNAILTNKFPRKEGKPTITADLTKKRFGILQNLINSGLFTKVWLLDGKKLRFTLENDRKVYSTTISDKKPQEIIDDCTFQASK